MYRYTYAKCRPKARHIRFMGRVIASRIILSTRYLPDKAPLVSPTSTIILYLFGTVVIPIRYCHRTNIVCSVLCASAARYTDIITGIFIISVLLRGEKREYRVDIHPPPLAPATVRHSKVYTSKIIRIEKHSRTHFECFHQKLLG